MSEFQKLPVTITAEPIRKKIKIKTREGTLYGYPGEWIITGIHGEKYPCKDDIFRESYQPTGKDKFSRKVWKRSGSVSVNLKRALRGIQWNSRKSGSGW